MFMMFLCTGQDSETAKSKRYHDRGATRLYETEPEATQFPPWEGLAQGEAAAKTGAWTVQG